ncbi:MAG TPA: permease-like cell division protein FtsX [Usitatibacter sp.]|nr:permease-like cell division protein FtsX [Usitatibacter sp.]
MRGLRLHGLAMAEAVRRLVAHPVTDLLSIVVLGLALALPLLAAVALRTAGAATASLDTQPHVNVFMALDATDADVKRAEQALRAQPGVAAVRFVSRTQALEELKATTHLADMLAALDDNPLPHAFTVRLAGGAGAESVERLRAQWARLPKVDSVSADFEWAERLGRWVRFGDRIVMVLFTVLAAAVAFIVGHLIRLQVVTRRAEIEVSQLVGATAADVRRPFAYHGLLQGLLAGLLGLGLTLAVAVWLETELRALTPAYALELKIVLPDLSMWVAVSAGAALLGLLGAWLAVDRELRRFALVRT